MAQEHHVEPLTVVVNWARSLGYEDYVLGDVPPPKDVAAILEPTPSPEKDALMEDLPISSDDDVPLVARSSPLKRSEKRRIVTSDSAASTDSDDTEDVAERTRFELKPIKRGRVMSYVRVPVSKLAGGSKGKAREVEAVDDRSEDGELGAEERDNEEPEAQQPVETETVDEDSVIDTEKYPWVKDAVRCSNVSGRSVEIDYWLGVYVLHEAPI